MEKYNDSRLIKEEIKLILFVDDEEYMHMAFDMMMVNFKNIEVIHAYGGNQALEILNKEEKIDLVFLDIMMPDIYGTDVLAYIRDDARLKDIKVIIQTGLADEKEIAKSIALTITDVIRKPYSKEDIIRIIENNL